MGAIADAMFRFAQPLIDATDGSPEQVQKALTLSQMCWNLAITPEAKRDDFLASMQPALRMDDEGFQEFNRDIARPMIRRHKEMFPAMQGPAGSNPSQRVPSQKDAAAIGTASYQEVPWYWAQRALPMR